MSGNQKEPLEIIQSNKDIKELFCTKYPHRNYFRAFFSRGQISICTTVPPPTPIYQLCHSCFPFSPKPQQLSTVSHMHQFYLHTTKLFADFTHQSTPIFSSLLRSFRSKASRGRGCRQHRLCTPRLSIPGNGIHMRKHPLNHLFIKAFSPFFLWKKNPNPPAPFTKIIVWLSSIKSDQKKNPLSKLSCCFSC